jgi:glycosyltransferase involved in cell wall biosynthesis
MKVLLIGPYPPPHGGISIHVDEVKEKTARAGMHCRVLNLNRNAPESPHYARFCSDVEFLFILLRHARRGWIFHLHANGHNRKNWLVTLAVGLVGQLASGCILTVHSGTTHIYLREGCIGRRVLARVSCSLFDRIIAVNGQIRSHLAALGVSPDRLEVVPAYFSGSTPPSPAELPAEFAALPEAPGPLLSTSLFFRPEYGFELLLCALGELRKRYPHLQCLFMGSGELQAEAERMIHQLGLEGTVKLAGDLPHEQCLALIAASDLFVRANLHDGDSISVREALSLGVPTVASDVGHRPKGAILFRAGDLNDLIGKIDAALATPREPRSRGTAEPAPGDAYRLLEIYNQFAVPGAEPTVART